MSLKSWLMPVLPMVIGLGFTIFSFITNQQVTDNEVRLLDYLLGLTLGTGAIGAAKKGHEAYIAYKSK